MNNNGKFFLNLKLNFFFHIRDNNENKKLRTLKFLSGGIWNVKMANEASGFQLLSPKLPHQIFAWVETVILLLVIIPIIKLFK